MTQKKFSGILLLLTMLILLATACRKNPVTPADPQPENPAGKLAKLSYPDGSYDSMFYDTNGRIIRIKNQHTVPMAFTEAYSIAYTADNKVDKISQDNGEYYTYTYHTGQLAAVAHYQGGKKRDYRIYDYENGKLSSIEEYYQINPNSSAYDYAGERKLFYYADGNLKQEVTYSFDPVTRAPVKDVTVAYLDYDTKLNPSDPLGRFLYLLSVPLATNNARKVTMKDEVNGHLTEFSFEYTYNEASKPVSRKMTYQSGAQTITETMQYQYY